MNPQGLVWYLIAAALGAGFMAALVWYLRAISLRRLPAPSFLLVALAVHLLLGMGTFYVYFDEGVMRQIKQELSELVVAARLQPPDPPQGRAGEAFERLADLPALPAAATDAIAPVELPSPNVPPVERLAPAAGPLPLPSATAAPETQFDSAVPSIPRYRPAAEGMAERVTLQPLPPVKPQPPSPLNTAKIDAPRQPADLSPQVPTLRAEPASPVVPPRSTAGMAPTLPLDAVPLPETLVRAARTGPEIAQPGPVALQAVRQTPEPPKPEPPLPAAKVDVARVDAKTPPPIPPFSSRETSSVEIAPQAAPLGPAFDPLAAVVPERAARSSQGLLPEDAIGLQAMFRLRRGDARREVVVAQGGSDATLEAVRRGLEWLARHQHADGHWSLHEFYNQPKGQNYPGRGSVRSDTAGTALAVLPFLGDGHTHQAGEHRETVRRAIDWLVKHQKPTGELNANSAGNSQMYAHGIAAIALCEAYGMTQDSALREPAQRSLAFIVAAQHEPSGGWRYYPNQAADTSVVGWQVMALKSGQIAGLAVPQKSLDLVANWLDAMEGKGDKAGRFQYQSGRGFTPAMTAEALLCVQFLGADRSHPRLQAGAKYLLANLPGKGKESSYYWYYATQVMYHMQGEHWKAWNGELRDLLVETQQKDGPLAGTWTPGDQWEHQAGRIYATSLRLLMLEVYYRHLPLYQRLEQ